MKIVFMGTPDFAVPALDKIVEEGHEVVAVVTQPDKPKNRGMKMQYSPVKECALKYNIPVFQPERIKKDREFIEMYKSFQADVCVVVAFGQILPREVLDAPKYGCINIHGSLLPKYRGAAPIQWSVINGDKITGITTMYMDEGLDTGDMILKREVTIGEEETTGELYDRLAKVGADTLIDTLKLIEEGNVKREKQPDDFTYAPMINKDIGAINWNKTSYEIKALVRGTNPWPSAFCELNGKRLKVHKVKILKELNGIPGSILKSNDKEGLVVATLDSALELVEIQPENKKRMLAKDYLRGNKI